MFDVALIVSLIGTCAQVIKEACKPTIAVENWENKELYYDDINNGVPIEQCMKNLKNGKYRQVKVYPEPHRDVNGKIVIENCLLYKDDVKNYGIVKAQQWAKQGKYNLSPEELEKENKRLENKYKYLCSL